ncbi:MAG: TolC family protein [Acidobacteriota bacterium]|nr:TolC family protein [Acidobacteriota bacterium]
MRSERRQALVATLAILLHAPAFLAQVAAPLEGITVTLPDAIARARKYGAQVETASIAAALAKQDTVQAKAAALPSLNAFNQFIYTEGNGTPSGVFVANDGVHVYNEQAVVHQELLSLVRRGEIRRAQAAEATAKAKLDVATRGLNFTVVQNYYTIVSAKRKLANAQLSLTEARRFLDITQKQERGGEVAHADVIKAQLQFQQRQRDVQDAQLNIDKAKIALAVLIFPSFQQDYSVADDLQAAAVLPRYPEVQTQAAASSPEVRSARASLVEAGYGISVARYAYLPSFALDFSYGINANQFAARTDTPALDIGRVPYRQNLGYSAQVTLNIPVWNWGATKSKIKQASLRERQAQSDLTIAQRQLQANLASYYKEAQTALAQMDSLRGSSEIAAESLRLTILRYQAGEATALEVVDAQSTLTLARNAYDDGLVRYRVALADLQTLTGSF